MSELGLVVGGLLFVLVLPWLLLPLLVTPLFLVEKMRTLFRRNS